MYDYNEAIELNPDLGMAYYDRANLYDTMGKRDKALDDYNVAVKLGPDDADNYNSRGCLYKDID